MARRGDALRDHILEQAKLVFLEAGFERTTMDAVAARASTSKRSLYAHFSTKEALFLAVIDHVDDLFQHRMGDPADYADDPVEATALYCARFLQFVRWESVVQTCRLGIAAADQFPEASAHLHSIFFDRTAERLAAHVHRSFDLEAALARTVANELLGATIYPELPRLLFAATPAAPDLPELGDLGDDADLATIRRRVRALLTIAIPPNQP